MKIIFFIIWLIIFPLFSCSEKTNIDIDNWNNKKEENGIIYDKGFVCIYDGINIPENFLRGNFISIENKIYFISKKIRGNKVLFYDFDMKINQCYKISYYKNNILKEYCLCLKDKFIDIKNNEIVFKFYFKNYGIAGNNSGIIYFVSPKKGILGSYLIIESNGRIKISRKMYGETFDYKYNYDTIERFVLE